MYKYIYIYIYIYVYIWAHDVCGGPSWHLRESWCALRLLGFFCAQVCSLCLSIWDPQPVVLALRCRSSVCVLSANDRHIVG